MLVGYGIFQSKDLGGGNLFFALCACLCADFGDAVVYYLDFDYLGVCAHHGGIYLVIRQEAIRGFQFLYKPFSIGYILESEHTVLFGFCGEECFFFCKLGFVCFEQTKQGTRNGFLCFTVDF